MPQIMPGTDFVCLGFLGDAELRQHVRRVQPGSDDYDDFNTIQRDLQVDGGLRHVEEKDILATRRGAP